MVNDKVEFDFGADFADSNYKSCFARAIAVNSCISQKQAAKSLQPASSSSFSTVLSGHSSSLSSSAVGLSAITGSTMIMNGNGMHHNGEVSSIGKGVEMQQDPVVVAIQNSSMMGLDTIVKLRKPLGISSEDTRRYSCNSGSAGSRRASICSSRITEVPDVETVLLQSQVDTLQWQLKQTLESRRMYCNVMKQVVTFLDRAHKNLQLLGKKMNTSMQPSTVSRSKSEHHVNGYHSREASISSATLPADCADYESISEYSWRQSRKPDPPSPDEVPPEKLSQEAFRLLRTVQSLLNTREPDLSCNIEPPPNPATTASPTPSDMDFLVQLAKEFPSQESPIHAHSSSYRTPIRTTSFSLSPKLLTPEKDNSNNLHRIATAFNRKLSLQLSDSTSYNLTNKQLTLIQHNSPRTSVADNDCGGLLSSTVTDEFKDPKAKFKFEPEKSNSPPVSTVSSIEDESGFSSMNSFQEIGLPVPDDPKMALLKSMLHSDDDDRRKTIMEDKKVEESMEEFSLWQRPQNGINGVHKRWSSTPVDAISNGNDKHGLKVLWV